MIIILAFENCFFLNRFFKGSWMVKVLNEDFNRKNSFQIEFCASVLT